MSHRVHEIFFGMLLVLIDMGVVIRHPLIKFGYAALSTSC